MPGTMSAGTSASDRGPVIRFTEVNLELPLRAPLLSQAAAPRPAARPVCYGHRLLDYDGICKHPHGHNAVAEIEVRSGSLDDRNMVCDFSDIKRIVKGWVDRELDHKMILREDDPLVEPLQRLGEPVFVVQSNPTVEHIAKLLYDYTHSQGFPVVRVTVWETPTSFATYGGRGVNIVLAVFDLDGTLIDSRQDLADSANALLAYYGASAIADEAIVSMVGCGAATLVKRVLHAAGLDVPLDEALQRFLSLYDGRLTYHTRPYDGIPEVLEQLHARDTGMALLTNKPLQQSWKFSDRSSSSKFFRWIVGGDGPWPRKPSPDAVRFLMKQASAGPVKRFSIGDSPVDLQTSRNAGVRVCLARYGFGLCRSVRGGPARRGGARRQSGGNRGGDPCTSIAPAGRAKEHSHRASSMFCRRSTRSLRSRSKTRRRPVRRPTTISSPTRSLSRSPHWSGRTRSSGWGSFPARRWSARKR